MGFQHVLGIARIPRTASQLLQSMYSCLGILLDNGEYSLEWCWSWSSNTLATSHEELTHWKRPWCWERLKAGGETDNRRWDGWMASLTWWTWVWASSRSWWWTGKPGVLQCMGSQRIGHDWVTELNWRLYMVLQNLQPFNLGSRKGKILIKIPNNLVLCLAH